MPLTLLRLNGQRKPADSSCIEMPRHPLDYFSKGEITKEYYKESLLDADRQSGKGGSDSDTASTSPSIGGGASSSTAAISRIAPSAGSRNAPSLPCPRCQRPMKSALHLRDIFRSVSAMHHQGMSNCTSCERSVYQISDVGRRSHYCVACEYILCPTCSVARASRRR